MPDKIDITPIDGKQQTVVPIPADLTPEQKVRFTGEIYTHVATTLGKEVTVTKSADGSALIFDAKFDASSITKEFYLTLFDAAKQREADAKSAVDTKLAQLAQLESAIDDAANGVDEKDVAAVVANLALADKLRRELLR